MGPPAAVAAVRVAVRAAIRDLSPGDLVLAACSGGADSLALTAALAFEAPRAGLRAGAVVVDHALQPGSRDQAERAAAMAAELGADPVDVVSANVDPAGAGPEAAARAARYAALDAAADRLGAVAVLLGHTRDDQAESVLLGLARGSGARSLAGMPAQRGRYRRPLLDLSRATTVAACADLGLVPWDDPHNADPAFARVRVRTAVLPVLEQELGPGVAESLARTARLLRDDADLLDALAAEAAARPDALEADALLGLPRAIRTRVLRRAALAAGAPATDLTAAHVDAVEALVTDWRGQGPIPLPGGVVAARQGRSLSLARPNGASEESA